MTRALGFGPIPEPRFIFVGRSDEGKYCWYFMNFDNNQREPIFEPALTGVITGIAMRPTHSEEGGDALKLEISILADAPYVIRVGFDTIFSRSVLAGIVALPDVRKAVTIVALPGEKRKVVLARVYDHTETKVFTAPEFNQMEIGALALEAARALGQSEVPRVEHKEREKPASSGKQATAGTTRSGVTEEERQQMQTEYIETIAEDKGLIIRDGNGVIKTGLEDHCFKKYAKHYAKLTRDEAVEYVDLLRAM